MTCPFRLAFDALHFQRPLEGSFSFDRPNSSSAKKKRGDVNGLSGN